MITIDRRTSVRLASAVAGAVLLSLPLTIRAGDKPPLDKAEVGVILSGAKARLAKCGALGEGRVTVVFRVGESGHVEELRVEPPYDDQPVGKCVAAIVRGLVFPENDGLAPPITFPVIVKGKPKEGPGGRHGTSL